MNSASSKIIRKQSLVRGRLYSIFYTQHRLLVYNVNYPELSLIFALGETDHTKGTWKVVVANNPDDDVEAASFGSDSNNDVESLEEDVIDAQMKSKHKEWDQRREKVCTEVCNLLYSFVYVFDLLFSVFILTSIMSFLQTLNFHCFRWLREKNST